MNYVFYGILLTVLISFYYIYSQIYLASYDVNAFSKKFMTNILQIILPVIVIFCMILLISFDSQYSLSILLLSVAALIVVYVLFFVGKFTLFQYIFNSYTMNILLGCILLVFLSMVSVVFSEKIRKLPGWIGFFANLLFYIPCMLRDFLKYVLNEYNNSSSTLIVLFLLQVLLLINYFYIYPYAYKKSFPDKIVLLDEPVMLNQQKYLDVVLDSKDKTNAFNSALSFWVYLNPNSNTKLGYSKETTLFNYSDVDEKVPHIKITYSNKDGNNDFNMYVGSKKYEISLPLQKWHNIVVNFISYDDVMPQNAQQETTEEPVVFKRYNTDIFIDGKLERSYDFNTETPVFIERDVLYIGNKSETKNANNDGLYGAICNVVFYKVPLTSLAVVYNYNLYSVKSIPIDEVY